MSGTRCASPASEARKAVSPGFWKPLQLTSPGPAAERVRTRFGWGWPGRGFTVIDFAVTAPRSEEHTSELQSQSNLVCRLLLENKKHASEVERAQSPLT